MFLRLAPVPIAEMYKHQCLVEFSAVTKPAVQYTSMKVPDQPVQYYGFSHI